MRSDTSLDRWRIDLLPVATLVMWLTCLSIGLIGKHFIIAPPARAKPTPNPVDVRFVKVSLTQSPALAAQTPPPPVPVPPDELIPPPPQPIPISTPAPFSVPAKKTAIPKTPAFVPPKSPGPVFQEIVYGQGEGQQPPPEYPLEAQLDGETGTVVVQFIVGTDGRVTSAQVSEPCMWPLLNQAAARSIRETWTYAAGPVRYYSIKIIYAPRQSK